MKNSLDPGGTKNRLNLKNTIKVGSDATSSEHSPRAGSQAPQSRAPRLEGILRHHGTLSANTPTPTSPPASRA